MGRGPQVGSVFPNVRADVGFAGLDANNIKSWSSLLANKTRCLVVTLPGAFTPT